MTHVPTPIEIVRLVVVATPDGRLDQDGAAKYLGCAPSTLKSWRTQGRGPKYVQFSEKGDVSYFVTELDNFIESSTKDPRVAA